MGQLLRGLGGEINWRRHDSKRLDGVEGDEGAFGDAEGGEDVEDAAEEVLFLEELIGAISFRAGD